MKKDMANNVGKCLTYQKVKAEYRHSAGKLQPIELPEWKWDQITRDFVVGLPRMVEGYDAIRVVVDRLTKSAHFIPIKVTFSVERLAGVYIANIVRLHEVPLLILSNRDARFTSQFWRYVQKTMGTRLKFSTAFTLKRMGN